METSLDTIKPGACVLVTSATGEQLSRRAITGPINGDDFRVVWVCREEEWSLAEAEDREAEGIPWPVEDVLVREPVHA